MTPECLWSRTSIPWKTGCSSHGYPFRLIPKVAPEYLAKGINTVDGYDIHGDSMASLKKQLDECAKQNGTTAIIGAGWDPGTDSVIRMLFMAIAPQGITYTNFGPGMSMGHSVAARAIPGVKDALSLTLPVGYGQHKRDVYVEVEEPGQFDEIAQQIKEDPYFVNDSTRVTMVDDVGKLKVMGHGVLIERMGASGTAHNQRLELKMTLTNPSARPDHGVCSQGFNAADRMLCFPKYPRSIYCPRTGRASSAFCMTGKHVKCSAQANLRPLFLVRLRHRAHTT